MTRITENSANYSFPTCFCKYKNTNLSLKQTNCLYELATLFAETR
jgi:hypothetical protein